MNDEIKEILNRLDYDEWEVDLYKVPITWCELYTIRDYITNLQQELDEAIDSKQWWNNRFNAVQRNYEDYKSRIEKTVEYIKDRFDEDKGIWIIDCYELLNILNGRSDE